MTGSVVVSRRWMVSEKIESFDVLPSDSDQVHVLAVDDSLVDRKVIERLLKITSCKVTAVESGRRALQFLGLDEEQSSSGGLKVDMVITDYCMPEMTGYELLKKIKESTTFREIPVVIMSSENVVARIDSCLEEGAEDFIVKPVKLADVKRLRDSMTKEAKSPTNKRKKVPEACPCDTDESPPLSPPSSLSTASSSSPSSSRSASAPCSPTALDSPIRLLKMTELL